MVKGDSKDIPSRQVGSKAYGLKEDYTAKLSLL